MLLEVVKSSEFEETHMKQVPKNNGWWCWGRNSFTSEGNNEEEKTSKSTKKMILIKWVLYRR
jgi:hypothetical protein